MVPHKAEDFQTRDLGHLDVQNQHSGKWEPVAVRKFSLSFDVIEYFPAVATNMNGSRQPGGLQGAGKNENIILIIFSQ